MHHSTAAAAAADSDADGDDAGDLFVISVIVRLSVCVSMQLEWNAPLSFAHCFMSCVLMQYAAVQFVSAYRLSSHFRLLACASTRAVLSARFLRELSLPLSSCAAAAAPPEYYYRPTGNGVAGPPRLPLILHASFMR